MIPTLKKKWPFLFLVLFLLILFRKVIFLGLLPIPSDLLVSWFFPFSSGGFTNYSSWTTHKGLVADDAIKQQYPWKVFALNQWKQGEVPLWNPYAFSGNPQAANLQTGAFYPLNSLFLFLDPKLAWTILIMLQPLLSFLFMYIFLRSLSLSREASTFGSLVFTGMTFELLWQEQMIIGHTTLWAPLVLTAIQKLSEGKKKWWIVGIVALSLSILAGYAQTTLYVFIIAFSFLVFKVFLQKRERRSLLIAGLSMFILPIALTAIQLLPTLEIYQNSAREGLTSREMFGKFLATPRHLLTVLSSDFFGNVATENFWGDQYQDFNLFFGAIALFIIIVGFFSAYQNKENLKEGKWFLILGILALLFALPPLGFLPLILNIPILSTGVPARFLFIFQFSGSIVSAFSLELLLTRKEKFSLKPAILLLLTLLLLTGGLFFFSKTSHDPAKIKNYYTSVRNVGLTTLISGLGLIALFLLSTKSKKNLGFIVLLLLASIEYLYLGSKYLPFAKNEYLFPKHPLFTFLQQNAGINRFWGGGTAYIGTNFPTYYGVYYPEGYDSLFVKRYGELIGFAQKGEMPAKIPRSDVNLGDQSKYKETAYDLLGVKYILDKNDIPKLDFEPEEWKFSPDRYKLVWQNGKFKAYQNLKAYPRIYLAEEVVVRNGDREILDELFKKPRLGRVAVVEEPINGISEGPQNGTVKINSYTANKINLSVQIQNKAFLVLSDNYFPGWKATIDGKPVKIYRTNYTFRGVVVPEGNHQVEFIYDPQSFKIGVGISTIGLVLTVILYLQYGKTKIPVKSI